MLRFFVFIASFLSLSHASIAWAALDFVFTTGDSATGIQSLANDSNKCPTEGPTAAYIGGNLTNTGGAVESNIVASLSGLAANFTITGTQTPTYTVGSLAPGESIFVGWHITYPCDPSKKGQPGPSSPALISLTSDSGSSDSANLTLNSRKSISANAGGNVINTTLGQGAVVGQTITADVQYDFGGNDFGDEFLTQPSGNTDFDAACLRLIGSEVIGSNVAAAPVGSMNTLYYVSPTSQSGNNYFITVRYFYRYLCAGTTSTARPYAVQTSGSSNIKYTGNYDDTSPDIVFNFPNSTNPFVISKTASDTMFIQGTGPHIVTYTVTLTNPSTLDSTIDRFVDVLPPNMTFQALDSVSDITSANSSSLPSTGATGTLTFSGINGSSYMLAGGSSLNLIYTAIIDDIEDTYVNFASAEVGGTVLDTDTFEVTIVGPAEIVATKSVSVYDPDSLGLYAIPGNDVVYTFDMENVGAGEADDGSLILSDTLPDDITFYFGDFDPNFPGMGPINFQAGSSNLSCCNGVEVEYSDSTSPPIVFGYTPDPGYDLDVRHIRIKPTGAFAASTTASLSFRAKIN